MISHQISLQKLDEENLPPVGFIKIDVEGHEFSVLQGAIQTLQKDRPNLLIEIEEQHAGSQFQDTFTLLHSLEYQPSYLQNGQFTPIKPDPSGEIHLPPDSIMILFTPKEKTLPG